MDTSGAANKLPLYLETGGQGFQLMRGSYDRKEVQERKAAGLKRCWKCERIFSIASFAKSKSRSDGLEAMCRDCTKAKRQIPRNKERARRARQEWRELNRERENADARRRYDPTKERERKQKERQRDQAALCRRRKKWRDKNREIVNANMRIWKRENPDRVRASGARYRDKNKDRLREKGQRYNKKNYERLRPKRKEYIRSHRGQVNARTARRTAARLRATPPWADLKAINRVSERMLHTVIKHAEAYADGAIHTNTIESFWAIIKRAWYGSHHHYSRKYMPLYIAESCYKYNRRSSATAFVDSVRMFVGATA